MKSINWNVEKNQWLLAIRGISFEDVVYCLQNAHLLDDLAHPNTIKYLHQRMFVIDLDGYVYLVPYVETADEIFLKTVIPSRKATKEYQRS